NRPQLTAILDDVFASQPMQHWYDVFSGLHVTFGAVRDAQQVVDDPQVRANGIVVPLEGAGQITSTISSPFQVQGVQKVAARRAPELSEHNAQILTELGFSSSAIDDLRATGAIPVPAQHAAVKA